MDIRSVLSKKGIKISQLSKTMDLPTSAIVSRIDGNPTAKVLEELAAAIGCQVGDFFPSTTPPEFSPIQSEPEIVCPRCGEKMYLSIKTGGEPAKDE